jgi:hypothetical protein
VGLRQIVFDHHRIWAAVIYTVQRTAAIPASLGFVATCLRRLARILRRLADTTQDEPTTQARHVGT